VIAARRSCELRQPGAERRHMGRRKHQLAGLEIGSTKLAALAMKAQTTNREWIGLGGARRGVDGRRHTTQWHRSTEHRHQGADSIDQDEQSLCRAPGEMDRPAASQSNSLSLRASSASSIMPIKKDRPSVPLR